MYFCRSINERQEFGYTKTLLRKQRTSVIFYSMDKNERIYNEQEMPAETKKNLSADVDRVKEVYKVTIAGSIINVVLLVLKFAAGILGHSAAMIADAIHSLTDFATDVVVLVFVKLGNKPKDKDHDYGHGKYETLATAIIGISLFVVGVMICYSGVTKTYRAICGEIICRSLRFKKNIVEQDETEQGMRKALNFGHTIGHGIEAVKGIKGRRTVGLYHGECVALGMLPMIESKALQKRVRAVYRRLGLPTRTTYDKEKVLAEMLHDKKAQSGQITIIKVPGLGCWRAETIPVEGLRPLLGMED